jgi:type IV pilus biogenesis/stability protein PilW
MRSVALALLLALAGCAHGPSPRDRETAVIHSDLGTEALRANRMQQALQEYDEALRVDETLPDAHLGRGLVLEYGFGRTDEAEAEYRRAVQLKPSFAEAHNNLGQLLARTGRLDEALKEFDAALGIMLYGEPWVARCNKGQVLWRMGRKDDGLAEMRTCLQLQPKYCQGWRELGRIQLADGNARDAVASFEEYARLCERTADAHYQLGVALLRTGQAARARDAFARCEEAGAGTPIAAECRRSKEQLR